MRSVQALALFVAVLLLAGWAYPQPPALRLPRLHRPSSPLDVPILMYHRVSTRVVGLAGLTVAPRQFAAEMEWLHGHGYHAVTQEQLYGALEYGLPLPPRPVMITFDDGYRDVLWNAAPVLHELHMPATAYVITGRISGSDPSFLTWGELVRLERLGFDIGSHTVHHIELAHVPPAEAWTELVDSRHSLEARLHHPVPWLSYPAGDVDPQVADLARRAGYRLAVTTSPGNEQYASNQLLLHRERVLALTTVSELAALVESPSR